MGSFRKIIGVLIIVFIALPILFGIIWAVGITKAVVSPEFLSDTPREVIAEIPGFVDHTLKSIQEEELVTSKNARAWIEAIGRAETTPRELMEKIGLLSWMENELSTAFQDLGDMLRGEIPPRDITLDMRPLKEALKHEAIDRYIMDILNTFPPCDIAQLEEWRDRGNLDDFWEHLPACRPPDPGIVSAMLAKWHEEIDFEIPDQVELMEGAEHLPRGLGVARTVVSLTYLLFLIPAAFIALGALIGANSRIGFLQWSGISIMAGGIPSLALALFAKNIVPVGLGLAHLDYSSELSMEFQEMLIDKFGGVIVAFTNQLFSPVVAVAGTVCVIGLVIYALSFAVSSPVQAGPTTPRGTTADAQGTQNRGTTESKGELKPATPPGDGTGPKEDGPESQDKKEGDPGTARE